MTEGTPPARRLRIAVLGGDSEAREWAADLSPSAELVPVCDVAELLAAGADQAVAFVSAVEGATLLRELSQREGAPPLTLLVGSGTEAHPHRRLVEALVHAKDEWEETFDAMVDPVVVLDARGRVVRANRRLAEVLGRRIPELLGAPHHEALGRPEGRDPLAESLASRRATTAETRYESLGGQHLVTTSPLAGEGGEVAVLKNVEEAKQRQEQMMLAFRLADVGQLAAGVAHELNTPLASIALRAESLLKAAEDPRLSQDPAFAKFPRYLRTIADDIFRCKRITTALLEFSRNRKPEVRPVDLSALAEKAADLMRHPMTLRQVALSVKLDPALPTVRADDGQLRQAIIALLMNALDAAPAGGNVEISTARGEPGMAVLTVADDGPGIAPEVRDKVFTPFFTTKPVGQGTGLGLTLCHAVVTSHGGRIELDSEPGRGTRVSLVLPIEGPPAPSSGATG